MSITMEAVHTSLITLVQSKDAEVADKGCPGADQSRAEHIIQIGVVRKLEGARQPR